MQRQHVLDVTADIIVQTRQLHTHRIMLVEGSARYLHVLKALLQGWMQALKRVKFCLGFIVDRQLRSAADRDFVGSSSGLELPYAAKNRGFEVQLCGLLIRLT